MTGETLSATEAADRFGVSRRTLTRWIASGKLPAVHENGRYTIAVADLQAVLDAAAKSTDSTKSDRADLAAEVDRLRAEIAAANDRAERAELRELAAQMRADEMLRAIDRMSRALFAAVPVPPTDARPDVVTVSERDGARVAEPAVAEPVRRRWWRRS